MYKKMERSYLVPYGWKINRKLERQIKRDVRLFAHPWMLFQFSQVLFFGRWNLNALQRKVNIEGQVVLLQVCLDPDLS